MGSLIGLAIQELPEIIAAFKAKAVAAGLPEPTEDEVHQAYLRAFASSLAKDNDWLAAHPTNDD